MTYAAILVKRYAEAHARCYGKPPSTPRPVIVREAPKPETSEPQPWTDPYVPRHRWQEIVKEVCEKHQVLVADVMGKSRRLVLIPARRECAQRMLDEVRLNGEPPSLVWIGKRFNRNHSTVHHWLYVRKSRRAPAQI